MKNRAIALKSVAALATVTLAAGALPAPAEAAVPRTAAPSATAAPSGAGADEAQPWIAPGAIVTNGYVYDAVRHSGDIVLRGRFSRIGRYSGPTLLLDAATGARGDGPVMDGEVSVSTPDGAGGWYVGGYFTRVDSGRRQNLLHLEADGSLDPQFRVPVIGQGGVYALQLVGTTLYVAGYFDRVAGAARHNLAAVSTTSNHVTPFVHDTADPVPEIAYGPATDSRAARLYVSADRDLLALDPATGRPVAGFDADVAPRAKLEIAVDGDRVYLGGRGIAALNADDGSLDPTFSTGGLMPAPTGYRPDDAVSALLVHDGRLYVGGDFAHLDGAPGPLAAFDLATGAPDPTFAPDITDLGPATDDRGVFDLSANGDDLWAGGRFGRAGSAPAPDLALLDASTGERLATTAPRPSGPVNAVDVSGGQLLVGGDFTMTDATRALGTATLDGTTLEPVTGGTTRSRPYGDLVDGGKVVYAIQPFEGGRSVLAFDPITGRAYGARSHRLADVSAATASRTRLYTVQSSAPSGRFGTTTVSAFSNTTGSLMNRFTLPYPGYVTAVRLEGSELLISGSFRRSFGPRHPANLSIVAVDRRTGKVDLGFDPHLDGPVYDLTPAGSPLVATGIFDRSNPRRPSTSQVHEHIARLDPATGHTSSVFTGAARNGATLALEPVDATTLMYRSNYGTRSRYVRFSTGALTTDPTGGYGAYASSFFDVTGGIGYLTSAEHYGLQYVARTPPDS